MKLNTRTGMVRLLSLLAGSILVAGACSDDDGSLKADTSPTTTEAALAPDAAAKVKTIQAGKLTACIDVANPPFGLDAEGQVDGIEPELVRGLAGRFALNGEFVPVARKDALSALDAGKCDVTAATVAVTEEAKLTHLFSDPYFVVYPSLLVRSADLPKFKDLDALDGRTIGVQAGTTGAEYAKKKAAGATVKEFGDVGSAGDLFTALERGQIDAVVHDLPINVHHSLSAGETTVAKIFTDAEKKQYALALPRESTDLKKLLDNALAQVKADDTYPTPLRRFLGEYAAQVLKDIGAP